MQIKCICEKSRHLKSIVDDSVIMCGKIISVIDSALTNVTNTVSTNCDIQKSDIKCIIIFVHTFLLVTILLFMIAINYYHYAKQRSKQKTIGTLTM